MKIIRPELEFDSCIIKGISFSKKEMSLELISNIYITYLLKILKRGGIHLNIKGIMII